MMFAYASTALVGAVSTAAIGRLGIPSLSAGIAIAAVLFDILLVSCNFLRSTTLGLTAIALGAERPAEARGVFQRALLVSLGLGGAIAVLRPIEAGVGLPLLGARGPVYQAAEGYVMIRALCAPFALGNYAILGALLGLGRAGEALALQLLLNGCNIVICLVTVSALHWGVEGVAWAAVLGEAVAFSAGLLRLRWLDGPLLRDLGQAVWGFGRWRAMAALNRDTLIRTLALLFAFAFFTSEGARFGEATLAGNAIHMQFFALSANCLDGFAAAAEQFAGRMVGARNLAGFVRTVRLTLAWSLCSGAAIALLYLVFGNAFIALLTTAAPVRAAAARSLVWAALVPLVAAPAFQLDGVFIGATWSREMRNMMLLALAIFLGSWALLTPAGNPGLWTAFVIFFAARGLTLGLALRVRLSNRLGPLSAGRVRPTSG